MFYKKLIPSTLLGRSLIIVFVPVITLVILTTLVFYQTSWNIISKRLTQSVVADLNVVVKLIDQNLETEAISIGKEDFKMQINIQKNSKVDNIIFIEQRGILSKRLKQSLINLKKPFSYDLSNIDNGVKIVIQLDKDLLTINVDKDRLYSETAFVFLLWMIFASILLLFLSYFFITAPFK